MRRKQQVQTRLEAIIKNLLSKAKHTGELVDLED